MVLKTLTLTNFRNYSKANFDFDSQTALVVGPNASGKTNLLEAVYFLATGKSFRATYDREVIAQGQPFANVKCQMSNVKNEEKELELQILASRGGEKTSSKRFKVNGVKKRLLDFAGNLRAVYFGPEDIGLVTGPPSRRRKYLDTILTQIDREYARALVEYERVLRQRNRLLVLIREGEGERSQLDFWDKRLWELGNILTERRAGFIDFLNRKLHSWLYLFTYWSMRPRGSVCDLERIREREILAGMTLWGPHRDDFRFLKSDRARPIRCPLRGDPYPADCSDGAAPVPAAELGSDLAVYGSRGEQRLAVLRLKLAELEFISEKVGERPVLLLDDIFSELDEDNRQQVLSLLGQQQTIVTATDLNRIDGEKLGECMVLRLPV